MADDNNTPDEELENDETEGSDEVEENTDEEEGSNITDGLAGVAAAGLAGDRKSVV